MTTLSGIRIYPVKSLGGIELDSAEVDEFGLRHDRRWMVVDAEGRFHTQRWRPRMSLVRARLQDDQLALSAPGAGTVQVPAGGDTQVRVMVWRHTGAAEHCGTEAAEWISDFLGETCSIVYMPDDGLRETQRRREESIGRVGFADAYPFLAISEASLDGLNARLRTPVPMNRFRPNLLVSGVAAHEEDSWDRVQVGSIPMVVTKRCDRCVLTTIDQDTGVGGTEPLRTLASYRRRGGDVEFGVYLAHRTTGRVRLGDPVRVSALT